MSRVAVVVGGIFLALSPAIYGLELALKAKNAWGYSLLVAWIPFYIWLSRSLHERHIVNRYISLVGAAAAVCAFAVGFYLRYG